MRFKILRSALPHSAHEKIFIDWISSTSELLGQLYQLEKYSPLKNNERSATGVFLGGAIKAGFPAVTEFSTDRRNRKDGRKWGSAQADLWFVASQEAFAFEFKLCNPNARWNRRLWDAVDDAFSDISRIRKNEADHRFACVIAPNFTGTPDEKLGEVLDDHGTHFAARFFAENALHADALFFQSIG